MIKMKKIGKKFAMLLLAGSCIIYSLAGCGKEEAKETGAMSATVTTTIVPTETVLSEAELQAKINAETLAVTVGTQKIYMDTMLFFIYTMETKGAYSEEYYQEVYGTSFWELEYAKDYTMRDLYKDYAMDSAVQYVILADKAKEQGLTLTDAEIAENKAYAENVLQSFTKEQLERNGMTLEAIEATTQRMALAEKYYDYFLSNIDITLEEIKAGMNPEDYKEYKTEYWYLATSKYDKNYEIVQFTQEEKEEVMRKMETVQEELLSGKTTDLLQKEYTGLLHETRTFLESGKTAEKAYKKASAKLEIGEYSVPVQTEYGIYVIKMIDNACMDSYNAAVEEAYETAVKDAFAVWYEETKAEYTITVNDIVWEPIVLGNVVYGE